VADTPAEDETTASENLLMALSVPEILMPSFGALTSKGYIECAVPLSVLCTAVGTVCPLFAPLSSGDDWWPDYLADADIRQRYFRTGTSELTRLSYRDVAIGCGSTRRSWSPPTGGCRRSGSVMICRTAITGAPV